MQQYKKSLQQIGSLIDRIDPGRDDELKAQIAQHICVRLSGVIENAIRENISRMIEATSHPRAIRFINKNLENFQNPKPEKIINLLEQFDKTWAAHITNFWEPEIKDAIGSIVGQRNLIAHGGSTDVSLVRVINWYKLAKKFCEHLEGMS